MVLWKSFLAIVFVVLGIYQLASQDSIPKPAEKIQLIAPDRPGLGEAVGIVQPRRVQIESGFAMTQISNYDSRWQQIAYNQTLVRLGITQRTELRLDFAYVGENYRSRNRTVSASTPFFMKLDDDRYQASEQLDSASMGFVPWRLGFKTCLVENKGWIPTVAFVTMVGIPATASREYRPDEISPTMELSFANPINDWLTICYNVGASWDGSSSTPLWYYAASSEFLWNDKIGAYLQFCGNTMRGTPTEWANQLGIMYYPTPNIQLDIAGGLTYLNAGEDVSYQTPFFLTAGIAWRLPR